ncbi:MAG TPA: TolC family protein [Candidatus Paceibacterota bacterium]|nr:TolC family protein [Verrucomicrobiota bacterium]HOX02894.1 TolC family protein [Verrucomicrobiota bacterium]HRZ45646.1 TolC family protein [Candidatus Paceibacterota bacterium]HRZ91840.1 TolC family protein [Candidatus Paceibacterota bacterium]
MRSIGSVLIVAVAGGILAGSWDGSRSRAAETAATLEPSNLSSNWLSRPLSLQDCLDIALDRNSAILRSQSDLQAAYGVAIQTRAIAIPKVVAAGKFQTIDDGLIEVPDLSGIPGGSSMSGAFRAPTESWNGGVQVVQSVFEGGRMAAAIRTARLTREQAILRHQAIVADTILEVRTAFFDVLSATNQIQVQEASIELLRKELTDTRSRYEAGTVPRFNFLRAGVELTNAMPRLIRARNAYRIAKNNLSNALGYNLPREVLEDLPLQLSGQLEYLPYPIQLPEAIAQALQRRPELAALQKLEQIRTEAVRSARAGYLPRIQGFAGYSGRNSSFASDLSASVHGWAIGVEGSWDLFDGLYTKGKVDEAKALERKAQVDLEDAARRIEIEVRTAYSNFIESREVLEAQQNVTLLAEEALRLAQARNEAGTGTQLDLLDAETSLTEARTTRFQALRDYAVARARLERAIGHAFVEPAQP